MAYSTKPLKADKKLTGISEKTMLIHHGKLYTGYVNKANEISEKLGALRTSGQAAGNPTFSDLRALKQGETFAVNGIYLHEIFFDLLGDTGGSKEAPELINAVVEKFGSVEEFIKYFSECAMAARGWAVLCWDIHEQKLKQYNGDAHNQAVWGCIPIIVLDVYEHAYFIDFGSDRKSYIESFWKNLDWAEAENIFLKASKMKL